MRRLRGSSQTIARVGGATSVPEALRISDGTSSCQLSRQSSCAGNLMLSLLPTVTIKAL